MSAAHATAATAAHGAVAAAHGTTGAATSALHSAGTTVAHHVAVKTAEKAAVETTRAVAGDKAASALELGIKVTSITDGLTNGLPDLSIPSSGSGDVSAQLGILTTVQNAADQATSKLSDTAGDKLSGLVDKRFDTAIDSIHANKESLPAQLKM